MKRLRAFFFYLRKDLGLAVLSLFFALISVASKMSIPFLAGKAIDQIKSGNTDISPYLFAMGALLLAGSFFRYVFDLVTSSLGQRVVKRMRDEAYESIIRAPIKTIDSHSKGDLLTRINGDIEVIQTGLISGVMAFYEGIVQIAITIGFMFAINYLLAIAVLLLSPLSVLVSKKVSGANSKNFKAMAKDNGALSAFSLEVLSSIDDVASYGAFESKKSEFEYRNETLRESCFKAEFASTWINPSTRLVNNIIYALLALGGSLLLAKNISIGVEFTVGGLSSFLAYATQFMTPFNEISNVIAELLNAISCFDRVIEAIGFERDVDGGSIQELGRVESVEAKDIVFGYDEGKTILNGFSLKANRGEKIAIVGATGCGKTTFLSLLMRYYEASHGAFYINGIDIKDVKKRGLRHKVGIVLQDPYLFPGSIKDNIAIAKKDATLEEIKEAARKAHADKIISRLPGGYEAILSGATSLSQGEKQLLSVARVMLSCPEVILLDEATSNVDLLLEKELGEAFDELTKDRTSFVVAHRLSTIKNADRIYVMDKGKVVESGTFSELMKIDGHFASIYKTQF